MADCQNEITPEDFFRLVVRKNEAGEYALAVNELSAVGFTDGAQCQDGIGWKDILMLVLNTEKNAINIIDVT
jgi:hypothetical protein